MERNKDGYNLCPICSESMGESECPRCRNETWCTSHGCALGCRPSEEDWRAWNEFDEPEHKQ